MPELRSFEGGGTPHTYDFESIRVSRKHRFDNVTDATHVLVPFKSLQVAGTLHLSKRTLTASQIDLIDGKPTLFWNCHTIMTTAEEGHWEMMRSFSYDREEREVEWLVMVKPLPGIFRHFFTARVPILWHRSIDGRFALVDDKEHLLITAHPQWRDSDADRGVAMQYVVHDRDHPLWIPALWSAFSIRPERLV